MRLERAKSILVGLGVAAVVAALPLAQALAATSTATFTVTADVASTCHIRANNLNFGDYVGVALTGTTTLEAVCSTGTLYTIGLNEGTSSGATVTSRRMTGPGAETLAYGLFQDAGHTINWGNTPGTDTEAGTGNGAVQSFTVFGQIPATQFIGPGDYADTITATLTF